MLLMPFQCSIQNARFSKCPIENPIWLLLPCLVLASCSGLPALLFGIESLKTSELLAGALHIHLKQMFNETSLSLSPAATSWWCCPRL